MNDTIVLYPAPGAGHLGAMVELGKLILHHYSHKFSIHILLTTGFLETPTTTSYLHSVSENNPSIVFHRFPFHQVDTSPTRSIAAIAYEFIRLNASNVLQALQEISKTCPIRALVIDFFCTSAFAVASDLGIPIYYFFTSGVAALAAYLYFPTVNKQVTQSFKDLKSRKLHIPGLPPLPATHMPEPVLDRDDPAYHDVLNFSWHLAKSNGIVVNTFDELEPIALKAITDGLCLPDATTPPIYNIGPLIAESESKPDEINDQNNKGSRHHCLSWLDKQPSKSVVFLCFGSRGSFPAEQLKEMAYGLEGSGHRFLWVVKKPPVDNKSKEVDSLAGVNIDQLMPEGFLGRTKERGLLVESWAPQTAVLRHGAIGGFMTHCGWNSVLEAVVAGVPMVAWPLYAEQHLNKATLVEDMKMAIPVEQREEDGFVSGEEVEKRVRELMDSEKGRELRERSIIMRDMALASWRVSGSSIGALAKLAKVWSGNDAT